MKLAPVLISMALTLAAADHGNPVTVHEWGTFTSVAAANGDPVPWAPLVGPPDLPCFVQSLPDVYKGMLYSRVRMETPVIYFYANRPETLSVRVDFPQGWITEWYPAASRSFRNQNASNVSGGRMEWDRVQVLPGADLTFPAGKDPAHYYAARATDAAPLRIGDQQEKLIFYRGVGNFDIPLRPRFTTGGQLEIANRGSETIPLVILFENRNGLSGFRIARSLKDSVTLTPPELSADQESIRQKLAIELQEFGLYKKEAEAMVETWRDSWFEEGMRVLYLMPRETVDAVLPLTISPAPASVARVFVGRVEVLSPAVHGSISAAFAAEDDAALMKFGRFLQPFARQIRVPSPALARVQNQIVGSFSRNQSCIY
jgi:hypothetical protein